MAQNQAGLLRDFAEQIGLDSGEFRGCLNSDRHAEAISANAALARALGLPGTPAVRVGSGRILTAMATPPKNRMAVALLSLIGLLVAVYMLAYALGLTGPVICGIGDCEAVQNSPFSRIGPFPVAGFGVAGYLVLMALAFMGLQPSFQESRMVSLGLLCGGVIGVAFSAYLTYLEAFVIHAWCQWCIASAIIMVLAFLASLPELKRLGGSS